MEEQIQIDVSPGSLVKRQKGEVTYPWSSYGYMHQVDILTWEQDCLVLTRRYPSILATVLAFIPAIAVGLPIMNAGGGVWMAVGTLAAVAIFLPLHQLLGRRMRGQHVQRLPSAEIIRIVRGVDPRPLWPNDPALVEFRKTPPDKDVYHIFVKSSKKPGKIDVHVFCLALPKEICNRDAYLAAQDQLDSVIAQVHPVDKM